MDDCICQRCQREYALHQDRQEPSKYCDQCAQILVMRYEQALEDVQGHGVTLPRQVAAMMTDNEKNYYAKGVDSQRRIAKQALKVEFAKEGV